MLTGLLDKDSVVPRHKVQQREYRLSNAAPAFHEPGVIKVIARGRGTSRMISPVAFICPASCSAVSPKPKKISPRTGPRMAVPVSLGDQQFTVNRKRRLWNRG